MKRMFYVSRFARPLSNRDLESIRESAVRNNRRKRVTGILVCLGDTFFQVIEGPSAAVDQLYHDRIVPDSRHMNVLCLKTESGFKQRMFPEWNMKVFNLNQHADTLPFAFRQMLTALLESHHMIAQYTQPSVFRMLERGVRPTSVPPRRTRVTVLYSDVIGFSHFAERLKPDTLIELVNSHAEVCTRAVSQIGGQVNKLTGDGVLAYFSNRTSDAAIQAAVAILKEMKRRRSRAARASSHRLLYGGVGLAHGLVYEGNVGIALKRDFTILGNTVNLASRLESMTRDLNVRLTLAPSVVRHTSESWTFVSLGKQRLKGQSYPLEIFSLRSLSRLRVSQIYEQIKLHVQQRRE